MSLPASSVADLLAGIAADQPAPGAGSGGAVVLAIGLACARKAIAITLRHHPDKAALAEAAAHLAGLTDQAVAGADADVTAFTAHIAARKAGDAAAEQQAEADLTAIARNLVALADEARERIGRVQQLIVPVMTNDITAALALLAAARTIHLACARESDAA